MCSSGIAVWNPGVFLARYPEFTTAYNANPSKFASYFIEAGLYLTNTPTSPLQDVPTRLLFLNMLVAHISFLNGDLSADGQSRPVGRVDSAGEGSVNASFAYSDENAAAWYNQSQYGAAFWTATTRFRRFRYVAQPTRINTPFPGSFRFPR